MDIHCQVLGVVKVVVVVVIGVVTVVVVIADIEVSLGCVVTAVVLPDFGSTDCHGANFGARVESKTLIEIVEVRRTVGVLRPEIEIVGSQFGEI